MAAAVGIMGGVGGCGSVSESWMNLKNLSKRKGQNGNKEKFRVSCVYSPSVADPYKTLRIQPGASESDVKKAFRKLALQYHPDVCRGSNCGIQFHEINEAYDIVISRLRGETTTSDMGMHDDMYDAGMEEPMRGMNDPDYDLWEEWMGWEGAGIRDYSSHINPYI